MRKSELRQLIKEEIEKFSRADGKNPYGVKNIKTVGYKDPENDVREVIVTNIDGSIFKGIYLDDRRTGKEYRDRNFIWIFNANDITPEFEKAITSVRSTKEENGNYIITDNAIWKLFGGYGHIQHSTGNTYVKRPKGF